MTINQIGKSLGRSLLKRGIDILGASVKLNPVEMASSEARGIIEGYFPSAKIVFMDNKYRTINLAEWKEIDDEIYNITKKQWEAEVWDCDDKAYTHKYWTLRIFGIPQFAIYGKVYDANNGKLMFYHLFNGRIADGKVYIYEPESGGLLVEATKDKVQIGGRIYEPLTVEF